MEARVCIVPVRRGGLSRLNEIINNGHKITYLSVSWDSMTKTVKVDCFSLSLQMAKCIKLLCTFSK